MVQAGWSVVGVDLSRLAIRRARRKAHLAGLTVDFRRLDVAELTGLIGPFDLALDIGCFHTLAAEQRDTYVGRLVQLLPPGADYLLYTFLADPADAGAWPPDELEIQHTFDAAFSVLSREFGMDQDRKSAWYHMRRRP